MPVVSIHQPQYIPWLGYYDKIDQSDAFCLLDTVQYKKNEYQNRNRIKTDKGWQWLSVPVTYRYPQLIREVRINKAETWARKHAQALRTFYRKAPYYSLYIDPILSLYEDRDWEFLVDINTACIRLFMDLLGIERKVALASELPALSDDPTQRLIDITRSLGGDTYLSGKDGAKYMEVDRFQKEAVGLRFQDFQSPRYPQLYGEFEPNLSIIDLLFNSGPASLSIIREARRRANVNPV